MKMYTLDEKLLTGCPEIRIGDKVYPVDSRTSTVKKMGKMNDMNDDGEILRLALGEKAAKEVEAMDMPFPAYLELIKLLVAAMTGEDEEDVNARFQEKSAG